MTRIADFEFDQPNHIYRVRGVAVPSVTQILEDVGIIDYSYIPWRTREFALERGSHVHIATAFDDQGTLDESSLREDITGHVDAWRRFRAETGFEADLIEFRSYHQDYGYAGTLDRLGRARSSENILLDIKTNDAPWWTRIQLAAYAAFFATPRIYRRMSVELHEDGTYRIQEFPCASWSSDFNDFLAALRVRNAKARTLKEQGRLAAA